MRAAGFRSTGGLGRALARWVVALWATIAPAGAQEIVTSPAPESVSVTLYRAPNRAADDAIDKNDPEGFALITETRTILLPAGRATIRFEGVAGNIFAETAIVSGLPQDVAEKNLDADLLSPRSLYDRALGRRVMIRRTDPATGRVREEQATIRSGAGGAAVLQLANGIDALGCSGLPEALVYDGVPDGLSAKPTLSVLTDSATARTVTLTLSYLAGGFDWQADYVVQMRPDGRGADLFAWVTLASSDVTSFVNAGTQVIAGKPNRESDWSDFGNVRGGRLDLKCWPLPRREVSGGGVPPLPPPPPPPPMAMMAPEMAQDIVVTGAVRTVQEELGDFKLYRIADPVTIASRAQKQVAFLSKQAVPLAAIYVSDIWEDNGGNPVLTLRAKNRAAEGLGVPLPAGQVAVFENAGSRPILIGESSTDDKAAGEDVEFKLDETVGVAADIDTIKENDRTATYALSVTNANPWPVAYEAKIGAPGGARVDGVGAKLGKRDGKTIWTKTIPANGAARLTYRIKQAR
ncbi:hypothetical protein G4G27_21220 [Sphingomonas sp. So64.6b]|uniref:DUF4139 domain-containing protein n=1 Tax=Sphingomonas sp. So64.6b TaxID=2997354 RepID=UPI0015FFE1CE|nr:hypothetical protein [Sphingomonas sp. So64.6b]QNA86220.1 hypothetical protein G4G27_21220 [Sphingomonas sp. So64.6b]